MLEVKVKGEQGKARVAKTFPRHMIIATRSEVEKRARSCGIVSATP